MSLTAKQRGVLKGMTTGAVVTLFAWRYRGGVPSRALGFALTFYPSVLMLIIIGVQAIRGWLA